MKAACSGVRAVSLRRGGSESESESSGSGICALQFEL